jgi:hypothetical protein
MNVARHIRSFVCFFILCPGSTSLRGDNTLLGYGVFVWGMAALLRSDDHDGCRDHHQGVAERRTASLFRMCVMNTREIMKKVHLYQYKRYSSSLGEEVNEQMKNPDSMRPSRLIDRELKVFRRAFQEQIAAVRESKMKGLSELAYDLDRECHAISKFVYASLNKSLTQEQQSRDLQMHDQNLENIFQKIVKVLDLKWSKS